MSCLRLLSAEQEMRRRRDEDGEEDEEVADELWSLRALQKQELNKVRIHCDPVQITLILSPVCNLVSGRSPVPVTAAFIQFVMVFRVCWQIQSNLGKIILKEELEKEKSAAPLRRKTRSLPDRSQHVGTFKPLL